MSKRRKYTFGQREYYHLVHSLHDTLDDIAESEGMEEMDKYGFKLFVGFNILLGSISKHCHVCREEGRTCEGDPFVDIDNLYGQMKDYFFKNEFKSSDGKGSVAKERLKSETHLN